MPFLDSLDIGNRALQHCGGTQISDVNEDSKNNNEVSFAYDKVRRAELRRNIWTFATRKVALRAVDTTTMLLNPRLYDATVTYLTGAVVQDTNGQHWISLKPDNLGNAPGGNNEYWDAYFGPLTVTLYDSTVSYFSGELIYKAGANPGSYQVYMSLKSGNTDVPDTATAWNVSTTYYADQVVSYGGDLWRSLIPFNLGITPAVGAAAWSATATYSIGNQVAAPNGRVFTSVTNGNIGHDPTTDDGTNWTGGTTYVGWSKTPTLVAAATSWLPLGDVSLKALTILYPLKSGPLSDTSTRNVYRLPAGHLKRAPQDPKAGATSVLGAPAGSPYRDWTFEGDYIVTGDVGPMIYRFIADVTVVREFDDMFCEGLACRVAEAICEPVTQSTSKLQTIMAEYNKFMGEARQANLIEVGPIEPPLDDFIACRA